MDSTIITLIASISGVILVSMLVALIKVITTFVNKNMTDSFNISKGFVRTEQLNEFKNELKKDLAIERVALQELLLSQLDKTIENKIKEIRNIGAKLVSVDETVLILEKLKDDFKDKVANMNLMSDEILTLRKELNKIKYGTENPNEETISRRKG